jgi:cullin-associated NEDD8-dissociated protein 1
MKIDTLNFLTVLLTQHSPSVLHPHIGAIIPAVVSSVDDSFYKITSEALLVLQLIVKTIRPLGTILLYFCIHTVHVSAGGWNSKWIDCH